MEDIKFTSRFFELMLDDVDSVKQAIEPETLELVQQKLRDLQDTDDEDEINAIGHAIIDLGMNSSAGDVFVSLNERALQYQGKGYEPQEFKPTRMGKVSTTVRGGDQVSVPSDKVKVKTLADLLSQRVGPIVLEPQIRTYRDSGEDGSGLAKEELRYANIGLFENDDPNNQSPCDRSEPLQNEKEYFLRVNIGQPMVWDCSKEEDRTPFLQEDLSEDGDWLKVVVSCQEDDFFVPIHFQYLFLPHQGDSWSCACAHNQVHTCTSEMREWYLYFKVTTTKKVGDLQLEIGFYLKNNLLQSRTFFAAVGTSLDPDMPSYYTVQNYRINNTMRVASSNFEHVSLNVAMGNDEINPSITLVGGNEDRDGSSYYRYHRLSDEALNDVLKSARKVLKDQYLIKKGKDFFSTLDKDNSKALKGEHGLLEDLYILADIGGNLYENIFGTVDSSYAELDDLFAREDPVHVVQICVKNIQDSSTPYLWSLIYDIPLHNDKKEWKPCKLLEEKNWETFKQQKGNYSSKCPFDAEHGPDVICPFGFWGFRHVISEPPSIGKRMDDLPDKINVKHNPILMAASFHKNTENWIDEMEELGKEANFSVEIASETREKFFNEMNDDLELVYLMCHCINERKPAAIQCDPSLKIGNDVIITTRDFTSWIRELHKDNPKHWRNTSPLVFINACHSVQLQPSDRVRFVDRFIAAHASGVIGTEVSVDPVFANEAANRFFSKFILEKKTVGEAIREMRIDFLSKGNIFGLIYTAYCLSNLHLA